MKKIFTGAFLIAALATSCSNNDITAIYGEGNDNPDAITLEVASAVARGADVTSATLKSDLTLYYVYTGESSLTTSAALPFTYAYDETDGDSWASTTNWDAITGYPAYFYGMVNSTSATNVVVTAGATGTVAETTVAAAAADQTDLVYFGTKLAAQATGGNITASYGHALSRFSIVSETSEALTFYFASVTLVDAENKATAVITPADEGASQSIAWTCTSDTTADFTFTVDGTTEAITTTDYMYLIPQTIAANTVVEVLYRSMTATGDFLGVTKGSDAEYYNYDSTDTAYADATLYIKVQYKFSAATTLVAGTAYKVTLPSASYGGQVVSGNYFTADGTETAIELNDGLKPGDDIVTNGVIKLTASVVDWGDDTTGGTLVNNTSDE